MKGKICYVLLLFGMLGLTMEAVGALPFRGWYELGGTFMENSELESFFDESVSHNEVEFEPGFRAAMGIGKELTRYVAIEAEGAFHYNSIRSIKDATSDDGELYQVPVFGNLVLQFPNRTRLVPVIGGGVGAVFSMLHADEIALGASEFSETEEAWSFAFQGFAGLLYSFRDDMALGLTYHYVNADGPTWNGRSGEDIEIDRLVTHSLGLTFSFRF